MRGQSIAGFFDASPYVSSMIRLPDVTFSLSGTAPAMAGDRTPVPFSLKMDDGE
ncbi:MAG: hypothetical protein ACKOPQ_03025 [Novosphingobium sp.]